MKPLVLCILCCMASVSCTTVGSFDTAGLNEHQAAIVADSMTADLSRYPESPVVPAGKPLFDAFTADLEAKGWDLRPSDRFEIRGSGWHKQYLRVQASKTSRNGVMVSMKTPHFDVHQGFETDEAGGIYPVTNPTLFLKGHEKR